MFCWHSATHSKPPPPHPWSFVVIVVVLFQVALHSTRSATVVACVVKDSASRWLLLLLVLEISLLG